MNFGLKMLAIVAAVAGAVPAAAIDVAIGSVQLGPADAGQLGRLSRNGVQQDWTGTEPFPGTVNPAISYGYASFAVPFAPNVNQTVYYDINFDDETTDLFASAYLDSYDPTNKALNWLGDAGTSGNYFPGDPLFFDVVVPAGHTLRFVVNSTTGRTPTSTAGYLISAFSDTQYSENFAAVPEPATWAVMMLGLGLAGSAMRRRGRAAVPA